MQLKTLEGYKLPEKFRSPHLNCHGKQLFLAGQTTSPVLFPRPNAIS